MGNIEAKKGRLSASDARPREALAFRKRRLPPVTPGALVPALRGGYRLVAVAFSAMMIAGNATATGQ
jgi:hypothetical protein